MDIRAAGTVFAAALILGFVVQTSCQIYESVLEEWIFDEPELVNYETCRRALAYSVPWPDALKDDPNFVSTYGINDIISFRRSNSPGAARASVIHRYKIWRGGIVPYTIDYSLSVQEKKLLACAFLFFHENTCVKFVPRSSSHRDYITIQRYGRGCFSEELGKKGGRHLINLHYPYCWQQGIIIHELMHALGFFHEQSRDDRDKYIKVHWENIPEGWKYQFLTGREQGLGQKLLGRYDYASIMHYARNSYAWGYKDVMTAKRGNVETNNKAMGNREKPTEMDVAKINELYSCSGSAGSKGGEGNEDDTRKTETGEKESSQLDGGLLRTPAVVLFLVVGILVLLVMAILFLICKRNQPFQFQQNYKFLLPRVWRGLSSSKLLSGTICHSSVPKAQKMTARSHNKSGKEIKISKNPKNARSTNCQGISKLSPSETAAKRPARPDELAMKRLYAERGHEMKKNSKIFGDFLSKKSAIAVPHRKAPAPPLIPAEDWKNKNVKISVKVLASKFEQQPKINKGRSHSESRVKAMKEKFEKL